MQTILGANGQIATELAKQLARYYTTEITLVSRHPKRVNDTDCLVTADLMDPKQTADAVAGSSIVYLTAGLPMNTAMWQAQWPIIMRNVIDACKLHQAKLVFFDNTYMYPQTDEVLTESTVFSPFGQKGKVRGAITTMLLQEIAADKIEAMICRAPEFYGPGKTQSITNATIFENIKMGKKPKVFLRDDKLRTLIFTPDASRAMALLGNTNDAYNQTWHLPCDDQRLTYKQFIALISDVYRKAIPYTVLAKWLLNIVALFDKNAKETLELLPRYQVDNLFDSSKFKKRFPKFEVTRYRAGIEQIKNEK